MYIFTVTTRHETLSSIIFKTNDKSKVVNYIKNNVEKLYYKIFSFHVEKSKEVKAYLKEMKEEGEDEDDYSELCTSNDLVEYLSKHKKKDDDEYIKLIKDYLKTCSEYQIMMILKLCETVGDNDDYTMKIKKHTDNTSKNSKYLIIKL